MTCVRTLELKCSNRGTGVTYSELKFLTGAQRAPNGIGIILSGSGSDGAKGIQAVKQAGGITFAQDESSARFHGMPSSAIRTGCVDFVLNPDNIALEPMSISRHPDFRGTSPGC
jgi:chemotaxis response regulator CheB